MAQRIQKQKSKQEDEQQEEATPPPPSAARETLQDIDDLLDEIDGLLEENASEFVAQYVQKGGE